MDLGGGLQVDHFDGVLGSQRGGTLVVVLDHQLVDLSSLCAGRNTQLLSTVTVVLADL